MNILDEKFYIEVRLGKVFVENLGMGEWAPSPQRQFQHYPPPQVGWISVGMGLIGWLAWIGMRGMVDLSPIVWPWL
jgi:hypothetical protein